ncbi:hypothetical protein [Polaromonas sp. JS666]|uniref:hypothetical protein n=1 Tax=Polaromonas sp. (strain JS666 / ATCC BAA-500) TaxID=296591 RepID=UPI000887F86D|nr:hypothetical protein [Polaromonas sp. JS666]SDN51330.1 hypothetical protein SAMN05720382_105299 [Polaromonas sp. JS666]
MNKDVRFTIFEKPLEPRERLSSDDPKYLEALKQHDETVEGVRKKIVESPRELFSHLLGALVTQPDTFASIAPKSVRRYGYVAKHFLAALSGREKSASPYVPLEQYCLDDTFSSNRTIYFRLFNVDPDDFMDSIFRELLEDYIDRLQNSIALVCHMVYRGLPLYVDEGSGNFRELESNDETLVFIKGMGKYFYPPDDCTAAPEWLLGLYLKPGDVDLYHLIYSQQDPPSPDEEKILMKAYQTGLGRTSGAGSEEKSSLKEKSDELFSMDDYADVRNDLLGQLNYLVDNVLKIPAEIFKDHGTSAFTMQLSQAAKDLPEAQDGAMYEKASKSFELLCASVPNVPRGALEALSMSYSALTLDYDNSMNTDKLLSRLSMLMAIATGVGKIFGMLPNASVVDVRSESERRAMLSRAGRLGAEKKNEGTATLKAWALSMASGLRGADRDIARKLILELPAELADKSKNPERLIYEALLKQRRK